MQKTKTFHALIFHKTWKYRVGLILATIYVIWHPIFMQDSKNLTVFPKKKNSGQPDKQANLRRVIHKTFTLTLWV